MDAEYIVKLFVILLASCMVFAIAYIMRVQDVSGEGDDRSFILGVLIGVLATSLISLLINL